MVFLCVVSYKAKKKKSHFQKGENAIGQIRYGDYKWVLFFHENESINAVTTDNWKSTLQEETSLKYLSKGLLLLYQGLDFKSWCVTDKMCNLRQVA